MLGLGALGDLAISEAPAYAYPLDVLGDERAGVRYVVTVELYPVNLSLGGSEAIASFPIASLPIETAGAVEPLFFATRAWATSPTDVPPNQPFDSRLRDPLNLTRSVLSGELFTGLVQAGGSLSIDNGDGAYDSYIDGYGLDGRRVVVKMGRDTDPYSSFVPLFEGTAREWRGSLATIEVILRDNGYKLDVPAQPNIYAGTGDDEGGDELAGKRRPLMLGTVFHGPLALVDPALLIYQANDGSIANTIDILDSGVELTPNGDNQSSYAGLVSVSVGSGEFELYPAGGYIKLGALPDGQVTFRDGLGKAIGSTAEAIRELLEVTTILDPQELDEASFTALDTDQDADIGLFLPADASDSAADAIADLLSGVGAFGSFDRLGRFFVRRIEGSSGSVADRFDETDIIDLDREALPQGLSPPPWRLRTTYQRNYQVMTGGLAASVSASDRAALEAAYLLTSASDPTILTGHPLAEDREPVENLFADKTDAQAEADRLLILFSSGRALWRVKLPRRALLLELGNVVEVSYPRFGLQGGRQMVVLECKPNLAGSEVDHAEIVAYG